MDRKIVLVKCGSYNDGTFWGVIEGDINIDWVKQISEAIKARTDRWNWTNTNDTKLERQGTEWVSVWKVYDMYPSIPREALDWFAPFLPWRTETIEEIRLVETKHEDRLL
jgi:hypothetical protein